MSVKPENFSSSQPPARPIGTECEYNLQLEEIGDARSAWDPKSMQSRGINNSFGYLGSKYGSGRIYLDVGNHVEFDTKAALGPAAAAVEDIESIDRLSRIVQSSEISHAGLYRVAGTYIQNGRVSADDSCERSSEGKSSGYHENYLIPRYVVEDKLLDMVVSTALSCRQWAMVGTIKDGAFVFSQKVWGTGGEPVEAAKQFSGDLTLTRVAKTLQGKTVTSLSAQESLLDLYESFEEKDIELPEDEKLAIVALRGLIDGLRASRPAETQYTAMARSRIDFAAKHQFVSRRKDGTHIPIDSHEAMQRNLLWDRVLPVGNGYNYWTQLASKDPLAEQVRKMAGKAGNIEREVNRAAMIDDSKVDGLVINWARYKDAQGTVRSLGNPIG